MKPAEILKEHAPEVEGLSEMADLYGVCKYTFYHMKKKEPHRFIRYCHGATAIKKKVNKGVIK